MKKQCAANSSHRKSERGNVLAYTVLSVLFLFFAVGLGVDLSHLYLAKAELQNAADAAALAGASALTVTPVSERIKTARKRAIDTMNLNKYNFNNRTFGVDPNQPLLCGAGQACLEFAINLNGTYKKETDLTFAEEEDVRFIRARTPSEPINMFFALTLLGTQNLDAKATSGLSIPGNVSFCPAPLTATLCDPADPTCIYEERLWGNCPTADPNGIQNYPDGSDCNPKLEFCKGCTYVIRYSGGNFNSPGNFGALDCGGKLIDNLAAYGEACKCGNVTAGDSIVVDTKTGVNAGPIAGGLNVRFDLYTNGLKERDWEIMPPDTNIEQGTSSGNGSNEVWTGISWAQYELGQPMVTPPDPSRDGVTNRRVLVLPLILNTSWTNGSSTVEVSSMGGFFMRNQANGTNGEIVAEYIGDNVTGVVGGDPTGGGATNVVTPVLYR